MIYNVNTDEIDRRLAFIPLITEVSLQLEGVKHDEDNAGVYRFAAERAVHLAAECITDIGNYLIDGFVMRDASSYEDIVDILYGEQVFPSERYTYLQSVVRLRKPLVQEYDRVDPNELFLVAQHLAKELPLFEQAVRHYLIHNLI